jgi:polyisoprenoid-binding protein YceI
MKKILFILLAVAAAAPAISQVYKTSAGKIRFVSKTDKETFDANNNQVSAALDAKSGKVEFSAPVNSFQFKKTLMQTHFQENYMETTKFPKSTFKGAIANIAAVNFKKDGTYNVSVKGTLTMHGVSKEITVPGTVVVAGGKVTLKAAFDVKPEDYAIKIPANNAAQIAKVINVAVDCTLASK